MTARASNKLRPGKKAPQPPTPEPGLRAAVGGLWWALLSGLLIFPSFPFRAEPASELWALGWFALVPLLWALRTAPPRRAFFYGAATGFVTNLGGFWWIVVVLSEFGQLPDGVSWPLTVLNAAYQGLQFGLFALFAAFLRPRAGGLPGPLLLAAIFTAVEYVFPMIFPWYLGNGQASCLPAVQIADLVGASGVTFLVVTANAVLFRVVEAVSGRARLPKLQVALGTALVAAALTYGFVRMEQVDVDIAKARTLRVGLVEANIGIWEKEARGMDPREQALTLHRNLLEHQRMSADLAAQDVDLIIWPESSYIPLGDAGAKRDDAFAMGLAADGRVFVWRDLGAGGFQWSNGPAIPRGGADLRAAGAVREDRVAFVGDGARVVLWDGHAFAEVPVDVPPEAKAPAFLGVAVVEAAGFHPTEDGAPVEIWAVGEAGAVFAGAPDRLRLVSSGTSKALRGIVMSSARRGVAVGDSGTVVILGPEGGRPLSLPVDANLHGVWAAPGSLDFIAVGAGGTIVRSDREGWKNEESPVHSTLRAVAGTPDGRLVLAAGDSGVVLRRGKGGVWAREPLAGAGDVVALTVDPFGAGLAADRQGRVWRRTAGPTAAAAGTWERLETPGVGPLTALVPLGWVRVLPIPKDARYLRQSQIDLPDAGAFMRAPDDELGLAPGDRGSVQRGFTTPILFGAISWQRRAEDRERLLYNTAVLLDERGRLVGTYDKVHRLIFGEYIPFGDVFPVFYEWIPAASNFAGGTEVKAFDWAGTRIGVFVCYEDILPAFSTQLAARDPQLLVNLTNDAWFGRTAEPYLHLQLARMRSVETRRTLVRSTNTGVSAIVDPVGRLLAQTDLDTPEQLVHDVSLMTERTVYTRIGDLFAQVLLFGVALLVVARRFATRRG
ncbi:MAG: apolipoprotein N-acyltransferase [Myxococcota bacterium]